MQPTEEPLDVIVVGAHPDDVEIACGGTLATLVDLGYRVGIIDLTDGEPTPHSPGPDVRRAEAEEAAKVLGVHVRKILPFTNRRLMDGFDERVALAIEFRRYKPKIVIGFGSKTPMAVFYSRLTKWEDVFQGTAPHVIDRQLYFRLSFEPAPASGIENSITVDITDTLEQKLEAIRCYKTQFPPTKAYIFDRVRGLAIAAGAAANCYAGETFVSTRSLRTKDLIQSALG
jgi:LmbE family N-acetylglucosaminyl deacetylase